MRKLLFKLKQGTESLNYGRHIIAEWGATHCNQQTGTAKVLDIGLGRCVDLLNIKNDCVTEPALFGVESYPPYIADAQKLGVDVASIDIERERIPYDDNFFDVVVANQILEHTKEVFFIISEIGRVLKPNGILIIGVPNLASLHNRFALLFGKQPTTIEVLGPHVRSYTRGTFTRFLEVNGYFEVTDFAGSNFYPFPPAISRILSRLRPEMAVGSFYLVRRTEKQGSFIEILEQRFFETPFYTGKPDARAAIPR